ncbi:MAG: ABC transporter ATP-binding protein [Acidobacteriota bacterium]
MLQIRDLVKIYPGPVPALRGIDLDVPTGLFGLLGPNGTGKSTLMRILAGLLLPTAGSVHLDGDDIVAHPERLWPRLGYLPQDFGLYPHLSGEAMLRHLLDLKGVDAPGGRRGLARTLLAEVNLAHAAKRPVRDYSGGMRQRLGIAQALAGDPRLVIVDEPTVGLDPDERLRLYRLLANRADERTVLLSTHIVDDVAMLCPRFAVLRRGRLLDVTTPQTAIAAIDGAIYEGTVDDDALDDLRGRYRVTQSLLVAGRHHLRVHVPDGAPPDGFAPAAPSLEDAYLLRMREAEAAERADGDAGTIQDAA